VTAHNVLAAALNADTAVGREYRRVRTPEAIHGMCEDYRAGATIDMHEPVMRTYYWIIIGRSL